MSELPDYLDEERKPEDLCGHPCSPEVVYCDDCVEYWNRMEDEGLWDRKIGRWTEKGWREMTK